MLSVSTAAGRAALTAASPFSPWAAVSARDVQRNTRRFEGGGEGKRRGSVGDRGGEPVQ
jgi:hypothetical protein